MALCESIWLWRTTVSTGPHALVDRCHLPLGALNGRGALKIEQQGAPMIRMVLITSILLSAAATPSHAGDCDRYRFGSVEWWNCKANQSGGSNLGPAFDALR